MSPVEGYHSGTTKKQIPPGHLSVNGFFSAICSIHLQSYFRQMPIETTSTNLRDFLHKSEHPEKRKGSQQRNYLI
jgi:hypothetical protein